MQKLYIISALNNKNQIIFQIQRLVQTCLREMCTVLTITTNNYGNI